MRLYVMSALAMQATNSGERVAIFDTDSAPIGIDNRCTGCISHVAKDFVGQLEESNRSIKGFGGSRTMGVKIGTLKWKWLDDNGNSHFLNTKVVLCPTRKGQITEPSALGPSTSGLQTNPRHDLRNQRKRSDTAMEPKEG